MPSNSRRSPVVERIGRAADRLFRFLASLKLAVLVIAGLAVILATGTILESVYDLQTSRFWIYRSPLFNSFLGLFGLNILVVALSRWPWKKRHIPFLLAHLGILILLAGSLVTQLRGLDGNLIVGEGQMSDAVELDDAVIQVTDLQVATGGVSQSFLLPWQPPHVKFEPKEISKYGLTVADYIVHADMDLRFVTFDPKQDSPAEPRGTALELALQGGPMGLDERVLLWGGSAEWSQFRMGPAELVLLPRETRAWPELKKFGGLGGRVELWLKPSGELGWRVSSSKSAPKSGVVPKSAVLPYTIALGWMGMELVVQSVTPEAVNRSGYKPARIQYGTNAPAGAVKLKLADRQGQPGAEHWFGMGERGQLGSLLVAFQPVRVRLPFGVRLEQFELKTYAGSMNPASYASHVSVDGVRSTISMNQPLQHKGYTLYQASYVPGDPRPTTTVLSVNQDPGRFWKYLGSLLIVLGAILLFHQKWLQRAQK